MSEKERILGIDPGVQAVGYGIVDASGRDAKLVKYGTITTDPNETFPVRLLQIYTELEDTIRTYAPQRVAFEKLVYHRNVSIALKLGQARGVALLAAAQAGLPTEEFSPTEIKNAVVGKGRAGKEQVQKMVQLLLGLPEPPDTEHAADALAAALTYIHSRQMKVLMKRGSR